MSNTELYEDMFRSDSMNLVDYISKIQDMINTQIEVIMISPVLARKLIEVKKDDFPPNVLFHLVNYISENEAILLKNDVKAMFLRKHMAGDIQLYTLAEIQDMFLSYH